MYKKDYFIKLNFFFVNRELIKKASELTLNRFLTHLFRKIQEETKSNTLNTN